VITAQGVGVIAARNLQDFVNIWGEGEDDGAPGVSIEEIVSIN
jgi:hypothetical protein